MKNLLFSLPPLTNRLRVLFLALLVAVAYHNTLENEWIGDDKALFTSNPFYKSLSNFPKIFTREAVMTPEDLSSASGEKSFSGCVSYRPVVAATFFADYAAWGGNRAGLRLTNIFLHWACAALFFGLAVLLTRDPSAAFFAAGLFALHPIQAEAVNTIGYRSDILMTLFALVALIGFWKARVSVGKDQARWLWLTAAGYFLALFSKESALALPLIMLAVDRLYFRDKLRISALFASGMLAVTAFYLIVYFVVFPNSFYLQTAPTAQAGYAQLIAALKTFWIYVSSLFFAAEITILPPLYTPPVYPLAWWHIALPLAALLALGALIAKTFKTRPPAALGLIWFFAAYLPVSGIVPLLNPLAYRFLYFPSAGLFLAAAVGAALLFENLRTRGAPERASVLLKGAVLGLCAALTIAANGFYKNDIVACREMIRRYPESSRPYWILGLEYYRMGRLDDAVKYLERHLSAPSNNPFISHDKEKFLTYHLLGLASRDPDTAIGYLSRAQKISPGSSVIYLDLARNFLAKGDTETALILAREAWTVDPRQTQAPVYLAHIYVETGRFDEAASTIARGIELFGLTPHLTAVQNHLEQRIKSHERKE